MFLDHHFNYLECEEDSENIITNGGSCAGSTGSMNNAMYQQVCCKGVYTSHSGRSKLRFTQKARGVCLSKKKKFFQL